MNVCQRVKEIVFYTRSRNSSSIQMVVITRDGAQLRFSRGKMKTEIIDCNLSVAEQLEVEAAAYRKARSFVPECDKYIVADSTKYYRFPKYKPEEVPPVTAQTQTDLDIVQSLLCEFQVAIGRFS